MTTYLQLGAFVKRIKNHRICLDGNFSCVSFLVAGTWSPYYSMGEVVSVGPGDLDFVPAEMVLLLYLARRSLCKYEFQRVFNLVVSSIYRNSES